MKKTGKIINTILVVIMLLFTLITTVQAGSANSILESTKPDYGAQGTDGITSVGKTIISWISIAGVVISVVVLTILGIKYMIGSASEKAEYKKTMIPYLVGAVLIFGASAIAGVVVNMATSLSNSAGAGM